MKLIVVGGHSRNIGKTGVMAGLIRSLSTFGWTAVKITQYGHGICSLDGDPCKCAPEEHPFVLTPENEVQSGSDTSRFLAAGATRSLWLRVRQGQLGQAMPLLEELLRSADHVMIESNSILEFLNPHLYLVILDTRRDDFKPSARQFLNRADGLVRIDPEEPHAPLGVLPLPRGWPEFEPDVWRGKPVFAVSSPHYSSPALVDFVRQKLETLDSKPP